MLLISERSRIIVWLCFTWNNFLKERKGKKNWFWVEIKMNICCENQFYAVWKPLTESNPDGESPFTPHHLPRRGKTKFSLFHSWVDKTGMSIRLLLIQSQTCTNLILIAKLPYSSILFSLYFQRPFQLFK